MRQANLSKEELAGRSKHSAPHILALFKEPDPNPTLELFLDLVEAAGARFHGVVLNKPKAVIKRLKEVMTRENISTLSALSTVSGVNRSQLSTMWNQKDPNPMLATFDRLVVALGAEQDFVLVSLHDAEVAAALAAGEAEVQTAKQVLRSHLYSVPGLSSEATKRAEAEVHEFVNARIDDLTARIKELYKKNVALEKLRDDQAAEIVRLNGLNATLERLRAEDAAEIARLKQENEELERQHAAAVAACQRMQQQNRELERHHAQAAAEAAHAQQQNRELESRHQQDVAALERLEAGARESWILKVLAGVAGVAGGVAGTVLYQRRHKP
jgi:transcriptional regulator with XRE-family HTH domain